MRRRLGLILLVVAIAILWRPFVRPLGAGAILVADIYSSALWDRNVAAYVTPPPRVEDGIEPIGTLDMRVTWWIPGWGSLHPAVMLVNGATEKGNDDPETRRLAEALGAYFDLDTYLASVLSLTQRRQDGTLEPWDADAEVRLRLPVAAAEALADPRDRDRITAELRANAGRLSGEPPGSLGTEGAALWRLLTATDYDIALERLHLLPASLREVFDSLSPRTTWSSLRPPVFWLHDVGDRFEPVSGAEKAAATAHAGPTRFQRTALLSHAAALGAGAKEKGLDFWASELAGLLLFAASALGAGVAGRHVRRLCHRVGRWRLNPGQRPFRRDW